LARGFKAGSLANTGGFEAMVALFDSTITFHSQYQQSRDLAALLDLLVLDRDNPRSLGWVAQTLRGRVAKLAGDAPAEATPLARDVVRPITWDLEALCTPGEDGSYATLRDHLERCTQCAFDVSDAIGAIYFTHSRDAKKSVGA
jgi:uncharacterized alpha-E superfamily protein